MSTIEDFKNAPVGATATHKATGNRVMKVDGVELRWITRWGRRLTDKEVVRWGFTLEPPAPTTAREALALAWDLAHEVKEGQAIPRGTQYLEFNGYGVRQCTASRDMKVSPGLAPVCRTMEPLPDPEPDWLDAPAVMARLGGWVSCADPQVFSRENRTGTQWVLDTKVYHWSELRDVTPLWPK